MKVGDLVKLHPQESILMPRHERERVGLIMSVDKCPLPAEPGAWRSQPATFHVLWAGTSEPEPEYEDGVVLVSGA